MMTDWAHFTVESGDDEIVRVSAPVEIAVCSFCGERTSCFIGTNDVGQGIAWCAIGHCDGCEGCADCEDNSMTYCETCQHIDQDYPDAAGWDNTTITDDCGDGCHA